MIMPIAEKVEWLRAKRDKAQDEWGDRINEWNVARARFIKSRSKVRFAELENARAACDMAADRFKRMEALFNAAEDQAVQESMAIMFAAERAQSPEFEFGEASR